MLKKMWYNDDMGRGKVRTMLTFLCGLTPDQWQRVNHQESTGNTERRPEGYKHAGLYEGKDTFWLIQSTGTAYRYWNYSNVFTLPTEERDREELIEVALQALDEANQLRTRAEELLDEATRLELIASQSFNAALIGSA